MNDIDFIKKCCEFADGFEWIEDQDGDDYIKETITDLKMFCASDCIDGFDIWKTLYPLLLQRAIEGINEAHMNVGSEYPCMDQCQYYIEVYRYHLVKSFPFEEYESKEDCKRAVLEHVFGELEK